MFTGWTFKEIGKAVILFIVYIVLAYAAMYPGYFSPVYWILFPIAAAFLMTGPLTVMMSMKRGIGSALLFPLIFFIVAKISGEMKFTCIWLPYLAVIVVSEILRDLIGTQKLLSIRAAAPAAMICMAFWNNGFYFGGQSYLDAAIADMGTEYTAAAAGISTPVMYVLVLAGVILASIVSERLTEKIAGIR